MGMLKLLIADGSEEFRLSLAQQLAGAYVIRMCRTGREARELFGTFRPDVMVVDLMLPELDGLSLIQQIREAGHQPQILATTRFYNDYVLRTVSRLGVGYLMVKPCDTRAAAARLRDLTEPVAAVTPAHPDLKTAVANQLLQLGIPTKLRGYGYLRESIIVYMRKPGQMMTKEIYPDVGKICEASADQVERSIRSAIEAGWDRRNEHVWGQFFPQQTGAGLRRPSNTVFISTLANQLAKDELFVNNLQTTGKTSNER